MAALHAGFVAVRGELIMTMSSDLQSDPGDLPALLEALASADAVVGWRQIRHDSFMKRASSRLATRVRDWVTGHHVRDSACGIRAMRRVCLDAIPPLDGMHRFFATLLSHRGVSRHRSTGQSSAPTFRSIQVRRREPRRARFRICSPCGG
jgi:dolichol-phosphate mannosyltransferase